MISPSLNALLFSTLNFSLVYFLFFFFQAEDGIRDHCVTGVQTCALPISQLDRLYQRVVDDPDQLWKAVTLRASGYGTGSVLLVTKRDHRVQARRAASGKIGRASCRERV